MNIFQKVTLKNLQKNRTRTLVTIVGIILSAAMFSATIISISSLRHWLIEASIYENGSWYGAFHDISWEDAKALGSSSHIRESVSMELLGYAFLENCTNEDKPYLGVYGIQEDFSDMMPLHLTRGRMPKNSSELLLPDHLSSNGGIAYDLDSSLELTLGTRKDSGGATLTNHTPYLNHLDKDQDDSENISEKDAGKANTKDGETLVPIESRTYKIVGFYQRPSFEDYSSPSYTALTTGDNNSAHTYSMYIRTVSGRNSVPTMENMYASLELTSPQCSFETNYDLLRLYGYSGESRYNTVLFGLAAILIAIIMFGSISLIYNAFSISISERTKQFGLLSSIGATKRQLTGSVLFEAFFLSCIGIPLGILSGLLGIGVTFFFTKDMIASVLGFPGSVSNYATARFILSLGPAKEVSLNPHVSFPALGLAICVSLLTILISAYIPVRRAVKISAIDAIRQTTDIAIRPGKVKTSRLTEKLFGFEGRLAAKNYKRNRKKYRATVISLFLSIVLFISTSSWCSYLTKSVSTVISDSDYDLYYIFHQEDGSSADALLSELKEVKNVTAATYSSNLYLPGIVKKDMVSQEFLDYQKRLAEDIGDDYHEFESILTDFKIIFLEDAAFRNYLKEQNLPESTFYDREHPTAVAVDTVSQYNGADGRYYQYSLFSSSRRSNLEVSLPLMRQKDDYDSGYLKTNQETGEIQCSYWIYSDDEDIGATASLEEGCLTIPLSLGAVKQKAPAMFPDTEGNLRLFYPYSFMDNVFSALEPDTEYWELPSNPPGEHISPQLLLQCENHTQTYETIHKLLAAKGLPAENLYDYAASVESDRAMMTVVNVFAFGFITLISLIAAANVFNTISTNISLRRREFAMLKSVGLTPKGFTRMMNFECLLYGFKGLLYGLPVSFLVTWYIYHTISNGLDTNFFIPWYSIAIAVGSVFLVVFVTMLYSMSKIGKENTIDVLKNENV